MALKIEKAESEAYEIERPVGCRSCHTRRDCESRIILLILERWKSIAAVTVVVVIVTYILTKIVMTRWYQATAIIEPFPKVRSKTEWKEAWEDSQAEECPRF